MNKPSNEEVVRFIIANEIMQYGERLESTLDNDDIHHGTELLKLWVKGVIIGCRDIALIGLEEHDKKLL